MQTTYLASLLGLFCFFAVWEAGNPRFPFADRAARWRHLARNCGLFAVLVAITYALALWVLPRMTPWPSNPPSGTAAGSGSGLFAQVVCGVVLLDLYEYAWHRCCHRNRWLWRLHQVHHSDPHLDVSTGMRFHPLELTCSLLIKTFLLTLLGLPPWLEAARILLNNPLALAQHANVQFPEWLERRCGWIIVTPAAHRIHHSVEARDYDRNFGEFFSWWDRLFGTYQAPVASVDNVGLPDFMDPRWHTLTGMLAMPWRAPRRPAGA